MEVAQENEIIDTSSGSGKSKYYLLIIIGEIFKEQQKETVLEKINQGINACVTGSDLDFDLNQELHHIVNHADPGQDTPRGEKVVDFTSEDCGLTFKLLANASVSGVTQSLKESSYPHVKHRSIIYAGQYFAGSGSWQLSDGVFTASNFLTLLRSSSHQVPTHLHTTPSWASTSWPAHLHLNPTYSPTEQPLSGAVALLAYISGLMVKVDDVSEVMALGSGVTGKFWHSRPVVYVFPGGDGDCSVVMVDGFSLLVNGGYERKSSAWQFLSCLDRLDSVLVSDISDSNILGIKSLLERQVQLTDSGSEVVRPNIKHLFFNSITSVPERAGDANGNTLQLDNLEYGEDLVLAASRLHIPCTPCVRAPTTPIQPLPLYFNLSSGTLQMYVLNPVRDSKELKDFLQAWSRHTASSTTSKLPPAEMISIAALVVWQPVDPTQNMVRMLFPGRASQVKLNEGLDKCKNLEFLKHPKCSDNSLKQAKVSSSKSLGRPSAVSSGRVSSAAPTPKPAKPSIPRPSAPKATASSTSLGRSKVAPPVVDKKPSSQSVRDRKAIPSRLGATKKPAATTAEVKGKGKEKAKSVVEHTDSTASTKVEVGSPSDSFMVNSMMEKPLDLVADVQPVEAHTFMDDLPPARIPSPLTPDLTSPQPEQLPLVDIAVEPEMDVALKPEMDVATMPPMDVAVKPEMDVAVKPEMDVAVKPEMDVALKPEMDVAVKPEMDVAVKPEMNVATKPETDVSVEPAIDVAVKPVIDIDVEPVIDLVSNEVDGYSNGGVVGEEGEGPMGVPEWVDESPTAGVESILNPLAAEFRMKEDEVKPDSGDINAKAASGDLNDEIGDSKDEVVELKEEVDEVEKEVKDEVEDKLEDEFINPEENIEVESGNVLYEAPNTGEYEEEGNRAEEGQVQHELLYNDNAGEENFSQDNAVDDIFSHGGVGEEQISRDKAGEDPFSNGNIEQYLGDVAVASEEQGLVEVTENKPYKEVLEDEGEIIGNDDQAVGKESDVVSHDLAVEGDVMQHDVDIMGDDGEEFKSGTDNMTEEVEGGDVLSEEGEVTKEGVMVDEEGAVMSEGVVVDDEGNVMSEGVVLDKEGNVISKGDVIGKEGEVVSEEGEVVSEERDVMNKGDVDEVGDVMREEGEVLSKGDVIGKEGNVMSEGVVVDDGCDVMREEGDVIGKEGEVVSEEGEVANNEEVDGGDVMSEEGAVMNKEGNVMNEQGVEMSEEGVVMSEEGVVMSEEGVVMSEEGVVMSEEGVVMSEEGDVMSEEGVNDRWATPHAAPSGRGGGEGFELEEERHSFYSSPRFEQEEEDSKMMFVENENYGSGDVASASVQVDYSQVGGAYQQLDTIPEVTTQAARTNGYAGSHEDGLPSPNMDGKGGGVGYNPFTTSSPPQQVGTPTTPDNPIASWGEPMGVPPVPAARESHDQSVLKKKGRLGPSQNIPNGRPNKSANGLKPTTGQFKRPDQARPSSTSNKLGSKMPRASILGPVTPVYVDLAYIPSSPPYLSFFRRVRAAHYVYSKADPTADILDALLEAKPMWGDDTLETTVIPTYQSASMSRWLAESENIDRLSKSNVKISPAVENCTLTLQGTPETSTHAYRIEY